MQDPTFLILLALSDRPRHGYGILLEAKELSGGTIRIGPGTLYGALERLEDAGHVELDREEIEDGRPRRYYRLTRRGRGVLVEETQRRENLVGLAKRRLAHR
ncbi:helix-turn-helix transcriptional regulator [Nannocystis pusilla]|uniref:Helix-turn-helix transcriptional regulator n=1 Tax=Nannocystis pusilla TaxID=889268 RepID=A0A9X3EJF3_9BACT|nr:helix-turn-helix transcriptional regulator [Nannocystis pusilla]MCY1004329.1 helix-turn-helix transcriptional regulator [Nannocystis pusilla]